MSNPTYSLTGIKAQVNQLGYQAFSSAAIQGIHKLQMLTHEAIDVINGITPTMFYKTMPSEIFAGQYQDVYRAISPNGIPLYVKFSLGPKGSVVISFKGL